MPSRLRISLCMIVRNEEKSLPNCLQSVQSLVDEMVVVDTGSEDRTVAIAESFGATVFPFPWESDFAVARNESLRHAQGDWIFCLDADERLDCMGKPDCLRQAAAAPDVQAYVVPIRNLRKNDGEEGSKITSSIRLFANRSEIRFEGAIHERVDSSLERMGACIGRAGFGIVHEGYDASLPKLYAKLQRNVELLQRRLEKDPTSAFDLYYLGLSFAALGRVEESIEVFRRALAGTGLTPILYAVLLNQIASYHLSRQEYRDVIGLAEKSLTHTSHQSSAFFLLGMAHYQQKELSVALPFLLKAQHFLRCRSEGHPGDLGHEIAVDEAELAKAIKVCQAGGNSDKARTAPVKERGSRQPNPRVSLCMIVKDEEQHLPECLDSIQAYVDEIVIVDTGSRDRTVEIARSHGAKLSSFKWNDSFADARNESLRQATGDWVIYLDADERLNPMDEVDCLRKAAAIEGVDAYYVSIVNHKVRSGRVDCDVHHNIRMFRKQPGIHFVNEVHEQVEPFLRKVGATCSRAGFLIEHLGYNLDHEGMIGKLERNLALSRKQLERDPDDAYALYYLGSVLVRLKQQAEGRQVLERALRGKGLTPGLQALILNPLGFVYFCEKQYDLALAKARASLAAVPNQYTAGLLLGLIFYHRQQYDLALEHLTKSHHFFSLPAELQQSELSQELLFLEKADLIKAIALCHLGRKEYEQAMPFFQKYLECHPEDAEIYRLFALCCLNCRDYSGALPYLRRAAELGMDSAAIAVPLAYAHFETGNPQEAVRCFMDAYGAGDVAGEPALQLLELMATRAEYAASYPQIFYRHQSLVKNASIARLCSLAKTLTAGGWYDLLLELCHWIPLRGEQGEHLLVAIVNHHFASKQIGGLISFLEKLARDYPEYPRLLDALGIAYLKEGDLLQSIAVHRQLWRLCPDNREVSRRLSGLFLQVGDRQAARRWLVKSRGGAEVMGKGR